MKYYSLSGERSLLKELRIVFNLLNHSYSLDEIKNKVYEDNLFQYSSTSSIQRVFSAIKKRIKNIDSELIKLFISESYDTQSIINLYLIMKSNKLIFDFMYEVIKDKYFFYDFQLKDSDINKFFEVKKIQVPEIANWSEKTIKRTKTEIKKILYDAGILKDKKTMEIQPLIISEDFKRYLISNNELIYLEAMGVKI